jgi:hypothetical protein
MVPVLSVLEPATNIMFAQWCGEVLVESVIFVQALCRE